MSEEAFLLKSLREVTRVWARASGQANFNLSIEDDQAHLQLGFQLGLPGDPHIPPSSSPPTPPRFKSSVRKERDRLRAAEHQAKLLATHNSSSNIAVSASESVPSTSITTQTSNKAVR